MPRNQSIIGVAPQEDNLDPDFSVLKNLTVYARYFDIPKDEALKTSRGATQVFPVGRKTRCTYNGIVHRYEAQIDFCKGTA